MMLDDTRCGLDASSLYRATSMDSYMVEKFKLISCHRDISIKILANISYFK